MNYFFAHADYTSARAAAAGLRRVSLLLLLLAGVGEWVGGWQRKHSPGNYNI